MPLAWPERIKEFNIRDALAPSIKFGALTGTTGFALGATWGLYRSRRPRLFAILASLHTFTLGTTFWATRSLLLHVRPFADPPTPLQNQPLTTAHFTDPPNAFDRLVASTLSGGFSGAFAGAVMSGRRGFVPGAFQIALFGYLGQRVYEWMDSRNSRRVEAQEVKLKEGWIDRVASMKWVGLTKLSDEEYVGMLEETRLKIEAQIALIEEEIGRMRDSGEEDVGDSGKLS